MIKVMFVCHGNICRSPMAEMVLKELARREGVSDRLVIASSATSTEEIYRGVGNPVYPPARAELKKQGIPCESHHACQLTRADYDRYNLLIGMDKYNLRNMERITGGDPAGKIRLLLSYAGRQEDVADPWYSGRFDVAFSDILEGCTALMDNLKQNGLLSRGPSEERNKLK
ncbi:MAG: low molecular weight phosphotyrosine protein phosphatase [Oscillospiraceae bacterium]|nr:low molecular weight phosphotyrosine protein phosphatase [Oscillospiraceae bacterium]